MPRYALRNQQKIQQAFGVDFLRLLLASLKEHFNSHIEIEEHTYDNEKFRVIHVPNVQPNTDSFFEFYVIAKKYDVYRLAYKSTMS
ncbi:hypothetical protein KDU71_07630 [Carboxylicivirga sediminis]|uniref:Uncharacterized protein n=1 Tax=Carboxylicivirga sediminis TaxID=2006564 RepID=A0A941F315_9BACT|nr:hypothetical protein [Carboxylicivirga sediminis]MBR8535427.1 hypothetical protein [Carboxylicivirga sediminis]